MLIHVIYTRHMMSYICRLSLDQDDIFAWDKFTQPEVLLLAALSAKWSNNDAIDRAVTSSLKGGQEALSGYQINSLVPFSPVDKKTSASFVGPDGKSMQACKGAPQVAFCCFASCVKCCFGREDAQCFIPWCCFYLFLL